jgi:CheY-like chemotaxis protein
MKILIVDRDEAAIHIAKSKLEAAGHVVVVEPSKNAASDRVQTGSFDLVLIDPSPLENARPTISGIRRAVGNYLYIALMSETLSKAQALEAGANSILSKPLDPAALELALVNARRLLKLVARIGDDSEDFPSAGGVIAKSAFNQLFISAMDRAGRYGEKTSLLFISVSNYQDILELDGTYAAEYAVAKLSQYLVLLRRQSDIIGQTARNEYALLLQRPGYEAEPMEAASRFAEALEKHDEITSGGASPVEVTVSLIEVPSGERLFSHVIAAPADR